MDAMKRMGFNEMVKLLEKTGQAANLTTPGPWTVFAMVDEGFNKMKIKSPDMYNTVTNNIERATLFMADHIVSGLVPRFGIRSGMSANSWEGPIYFDSVDNGLVIIKPNKLLLNPNFTSFLVLFCSELPSMEVVAFWENSTPTMV